MSRKKSIWDLAAKAQAEVEKWPAWKIAAADTALVSRPDREPASRDQSKRNYHMSMRSIGGGRWRCDYCGDEFDVSQMRSSDCSHVYEVCEACGGCEESNECRPDCPGIAGIFADPKVYVAGSKSK